MKDHKQNLQNGYDINLMYVNTFFLGKQSCVVSGR